MHEAALSSSTEPLTQHRIVGLEPDQEPLVNGVALEKGVLRSLSRANEQDLCLSASFERGGGIDFCRESGYQGVVHFPQGSKPLQNTATKSP